MRFMFIVKSAHTGGPPPPKLLEAMHKLANREMSAGRMLDNGGLHAAAQGPLPWLGRDVRASHVCFARRPLRREHEARSAATMAADAQREHDLLKRRAGEAADAAMPS
jgi:hypothetical protein